MAKNGATLDYKFGQKNHWRRTIWNAIATRTKDRRNATVVYLAGQQDLDRPIAISRGFSDVNLIACDKSASVARALRERGTITVQGDFFAMLRAWPQSRKINVLLGDFCCGLDIKIIDEIARTLIICPALHGAVCCFNWMRGRDQSTNDLRSYIGDAWDLNGLDKKNRASVFWCYMMERFLLPDSVSEIERADLILFNRRYGAFVKKFPPAFFSYRSVTGQVFDSIVFVSPTVFLSETPDATFRTKIDIASEYLRKNFAGKQRRRVAAALAHQTMKKKCVGPYSEVDR